MGKLAFFTNPTSIAVIGASSAAGKVGYTVVDNIKTSGYTGKVYPINPKAPEINGFKAYPNITACPETPELAVFVIPAKHCLATAEECGQKGVRGCVIISAGFKEVGGDGIELEQKLVAIGKKYDMRIVGPNVLGVSTPSFNCTFASRHPRKGPIAFLSQSGAMLTSILDWSFANNIGFSNFISLGNKCDVHETELIEEVCEDDNTKIILLYLESIVDGPAFLERVSVASRKKPIIILKSGTSLAGAAAASSHTGALAGNDIAFDLAFAQAGVIRAKTMSELFSLARLFSNTNFNTLKAVQDRKFVIITNAGGPGIIATDAFETFGVSLSQMTEATKDALRKALPEEASVKNPVDVIGDATPDRYAKAMEIAFTDPNVDGCLVLVTPQAQTQPDEVARLCVEVQKKNPDKLIVTSFMGGDTMKSPAQILATGNISNYDFPEPALQAIRAVCDYAKLRLLPSAASDCGDVCGFKDQKKHDRIVQIFKEVREDDRTVLLSHETSEIFQIMGVSAPLTKLAATKEEAGKFADELKYPIVMKIVSAQIMHKSDCGGVKLFLKTKEECIAAFDEIMHNAKTRGPSGAILKGVEVQQMVDFTKKNKSTEVIVGMNRDGNFGPMIMFGQGGVYANYVKDVAFELSYGYTREKAFEQLKKTKINAILEGVRGQPRSDIDGLVDILVKLSQLVTKFPEIQELDMNPLLVFDDSIAAVDVKITI
ncbi:Acetyl-CoA synthetase [Spironucleus salmonicida]|uniref:Acetyl-CoA synthetase n=2 Tax=Spironucleus TaxID=39709 RepID=K7R1J6_9EUKA|nr:acetyl-CoA synthetase [Spironucleus salmonicida]KAH0570130.1 Acetyl-CoA synthetase [Spironucleus salmonicida]|eukprot:EST42788.1 Acetyl-CoA synthetase [Spironucleus salmonicida]